MRRQQQAYDLIKNDQEDKDNEIESLIDKRVDIQQELRARHSQLKEVKAQMMELKEERRIQEANERKRKKE